MNKYILRAKRTQKIIEVFETFEAAVKQLRYNEAMDKTLDVYRPDCYEILCVERCTEIVLTNKDGSQHRYSSISMALDEKKKIGGKVEVRQTMRETIVSSNEVYYVY